MKKGRGGRARAVDEDGDEDEDVVARRAAQLQVGEEGQQHREPAGRAREGDFDYVTLYDNTAKRAMT